VKKVKEIYTPANAPYPYYARNFQAKERAEVVREWIRHGDMRYDHLELLQQDGEYFLFALGRMENSAWNGVKVPPDKAKELAEEADYGSVVSYYESQL
jgi:hypothetical protein